MDVKRCSRCNQVKSVEAFHRWKRDGRQPWCKACRKEYDADYHRRTWNQERRTLKQQRRREFAAWYRDLKSGPCADCGLRFDPAVMHWDHMPGSTKSANVSDLAGAGSRLRLLAELEKCELVCANCHALRTVRRLGA